MVLVAGRAQAHSHNPVVCLAKNIYYEASGESFDGKVAVAQVTVNRADGDPRKVCAVVYFKARSQVDGKIEASFSWTLGKAWREKGPIDLKVMRECILIARAVLAGVLHSRFDSAVKYYHTVSVHPHWHYVFVCRIGRELFYRRHRVLMASR